MGDHEETPQEWLDRMDREDRRMWGWVLVLVAAASVAIVISAVVAEHA